MRGIVDRKGEQFGYVIGDRLFTLDDEPSGHLTREYVVDLSGSPVWRRIGDGLYSLDGSETIGFLTAERLDEEDYF
jgi:hypothetical protein